MHPLADQVQRTTRTRRLFLSPRILVAVSGGLDSMVLLDLLHELAPANGWKLTIAHLNHQLRGRSSEADERFVRRAAQQLEIPLVVERQVQRFARARKLSLEMAARELRHDFLARVARQKRIKEVALAHHADDQVELFFLRLLRGSGSQGLSGMKWRSPSPADGRIMIVRPLLVHPKAALQAYAEMRGLPFRQDATNACLDIQRNRIRHELLPLLRDKYQPALQRTVPRIADILAAEADFISQVATAWLEQKRGWNMAQAGPGPLAGPSEPHSHPILLATDSFDELPVAIQRRCLQLQMFAPGLVPEYEVIEQLRARADRAVVVKPASDQKHSDPGRRAHNQTHKAATLELSRDSTGIVRHTPRHSVAFQSRQLEVEIGDPAGEMIFEGLHLTWRIFANDWKQTIKRIAGGEIFDADCVGSRITLRHWRPGDRFQPIGMENAVKLQDLFTNAKIPRPRRHDLVVAVTCAGQLFWVEGLRISQCAKLTKLTKRCLHWQWQRP